MKKPVTYLVPTDFSAVSRTAALYAAQMAAPLHARVRLLSVIEMDTSEVVLSNWAKLEKQMHRTALRELSKMQQDLKTTTGNKVTIECAITAGIPKHEAISKYAVKEKVNFIVMGTKGAAGLQKNSKRQQHGAPSGCNQSACRRRSRKGHIRRLEADCLCQRPQERSGRDESNLPGRLIVQFGNNDSPLCADQGRPDGESES